MLTPDLKEIFFRQDFTDDTICELDEAREKSSAALDKLAEKYKLSFIERDEIESSGTHESVMSQYLGFMQGFKWAVYLLTGHRDGQESVEKERA